MAAPPSYFAREAKIHGHGEMMQTLKARTAGRSGESPKLSWDKPVSQDNGSASMASTDGRYVLRKAANEKGTLYYAWLNEPRKLLGYSTDLEIAKAHCEAHSLGSGS